jgi:hypothetical protein
MLKSELIKENERLRRELSLVCCHPYNLDSVLIIKKEQMKYRIEKAIWMGDFEATDIQAKAWHIIEGLKEKHGE